MTAPLTDAQRLLVESHPRLHFWAVRKFFPSLRGDAAEEAFGVAALAVVRAAAHFDPARGVAFKTYATKAAWSEVHKSLYRRRGRGPRHPEAAPPERLDRTAAPDRRAEADARMDAAALLPKIGGNGLAAVRLRYGLGVPQAADDRAVGEALGMTLHAAQKCRRRALAELKEFCEPRVR